jgi:hypothetical protein
MENKAKFPRKEIENHFDYRNFSILTQVRPFVQNAMDRDHSLGARSSLMYMLKEDTRWLYKRDEHLSLIMMGWGGEEWKKDSRRIMKCPSIMYIKFGTNTNQVFPDNAC